MDNNQFKSILNRELNIVKQAYNTLVGISPIEKLILSKLDKNKTIIVEKLLNIIHIHADLIDEVIQKITTNGDIPFLEVAESISYFYENEFHPNKDKLNGLYFESFMRGIELDLEGLDFGHSESFKNEFNYIIEVENDVESNNIFNTFELAIENWEFTMEQNSEDDSYIENIKNSKNILYTSYFRPDEWFSNAQKLNPIISSFPAKKLPIHAKVRLKEIYRSFIFGNLISVISLSRSFLEYTLIYRASNMGYDAYCIKNGNTYTKRLESLVEEAGLVYPELKLDMEIVREHGNKVLHPKKKDKIITYPKLLKSNALDSLEAVRKIALKIYA